MILALAIGGVAFGASRPSQADVLEGESPRVFGVAPRLSVELRDTHLALGGEVRFTVVSFGPSVRLDIRPSFDYYIYNGGSLIGLSGDGLFSYDLRNEIIEPYLGVGLAVFIAAADAADTVTRVGLDLLFGLRFLPHQRIQPFAELRATVGDIDPILLTGGVLFTF